MFDLTPDDLTCLVGLLAAALNPLLSGGIESRKQALVLGLAQLIVADTWIWAVGQVDASHESQIMAVTLLDGGWRDEPERLAVLQAIGHPTFRSVIEPCFDVVRNNNALTISSVDLFQSEDTAGRQIWQTTGLEHFLISIYPLGNGKASAIGMHRRRGNPAFGNRERLLLGSVFQNVPWLHSCNDRTNSEDNIAGLSPREREVTLLLLDGCARKEVARRLGLSEHTISDP